MDRLPDGMDSKGAGPAPASDRPPRLFSGKASVATSIPGAVAGVLLVAALAFGAAAILPDIGGSGHEGDTAVVEPTVASDEAPPAGEPGDEAIDEAPVEDEPGVEEELAPKPNGQVVPTEKPTEKPAPKPTEKPAPKPTEAPAPKPAAMGLDLIGIDCGVKVVWSAFDGAGLEYYKVVRSTDEKVSWPLGAHDSLIGVVSPDGELRVKDCAAPDGRVYYRVFAVRHGEDGYIVLGSSPVRSIVVEKPTPTPTSEPYVMGLEVGASADGIVLSWEASTADGLAGYKIVRSMTNENPTYPVNDGTEKVAFIDDHAATTWTDTAVAGGETWFYRVYSIGTTDGGDWFILGRTPVGSATAP